MVGFSKGAKAPNIPREIDKPWHDLLISRLPWNNQQAAKEGYRRVYTETMESMPDDHRRENAAARAANLRLLAYAERVLGRQTVEQLTNQATKRRR